jgi:hypothetical protein
MNNKMTFVQAHYTKFNNLKKIQDVFRINPEQRASTPKAYDGLVADFKNPFTEEFLSAFEIYEKYNLPEFRVLLNDGHIVKIRKKNGGFLVEKTIDENK